MKESDISTFIEELESIGDIWTPEQVEEVYGNFSLRDALADRKSSYGTFFNIIAKIINRN